MKTLKSILASSLIGLSTLLPARAEVIDFPINFRNIEGQALQSYYDSAQDGDTIRFFKVDQPDYPYGIIADDEKNVTIDLNGNIWNGGADIISYAGNGLTITGNGGILNYSGFKVYGDADLTIDNVFFNRFDKAINWNSSGNLTITNSSAQSWNEGVGTLVYAPELIGDSKITINRNIIYQADKLISIGTEEYATTPIISITHNTTNEVTNPFTFENNLSKTKGQISNNSFSKLETLVTNPLYAKGIKVISNNIYDYDAVSKEDGLKFIGLSSMTLGYPLQLDEVLSLEESNYFFNPQFTGQDWNDFTLTQSSPLIDRGINLGQPYLGNAPDIGRWESDYAGGVPEPTSLTLLCIGASALLNRRRKNETI
jgi:hypothetical protein